MEGQGTICLALTQDDGTIRLAVEDSGPGIPDDDVEAVFQPFFSTKDHGEGTGLGLAVCRKLINDHGGEIQVGKSELGGAKVVITLPATVES